MKINYMNFTLLITACLILNACASGARPEMMVVTPIETNLISASNQYFQAIEIQNVSGGKKTNPMWTSEVDDTSFQEALKQSLKAHNLLNENGSSQYLLDAKMIEIKQPLFGITLTVPSSVSYTLKDSSNNIVVDETVTADGQATMGDAFIAVERLRLANENSIKNNIQSFIERLK